MASSINLSKQLREVYERGDYSKALQSTNNRVEISFAVCMIFTIGAIVTAYLLHGNNLPLAFKGVLYSAIILGATSCILGIAHQILSPYQRSAQHKANEADSAFRQVLLNPEWIENSALISELAQNPSRVVSNLMLFSSEQIKALMKVNGHAICAHANTTISKILRKHCNGPDELCQVLSTHFGKCSPDNTVDSFLRAFSYVDRLEEIDAETVELRMHVCEHNEFTSDGSYSLFNFES